MKVLVIADPIVPVPPVNYGGSERIVHLMCRGLSKRGHQIHLLAGPGSRLDGARVTIHRAPSSGLMSRAFRKIWFQYLLLSAASGADVVVNHGRIDYLEALYRTLRPVVHWFHNPLTGMEVSYLSRRRSRGDVLVGVSCSQVESDPASGRFQVVPNALDFEAVPFSPEPQVPRYVLFLGRLTRNKGVHVAISAARKARVRLVLAGNISNEAGDAEYFELMVKPNLGPDCEWVGPYDDTLRSRLLSGASALLFPIQWREPFGLVMIEAMAAGVPVIASRRASTPEVVLHGRTGFLCDTVEEMAAAIGQVHQLSRRDCRAAAEERFSEPVFISRVEALLDHARRFP